MAHVREQPSPTPLTSTPGPVSITAGARMNTARKVSSLHGSLHGAVVTCIYCMPGRTRCMDDPVPLVRGHAVPAHCLPVDWIKHKTQMPRGNSDAPQQHPPFHGQALWTGVEHGTSSNQSTSPAQQPTPSLNSTRHTQRCSAHPPKALMSCGAASGASKLLICGCEDQGS